MAEISVTEISRCAGGEVIGDPRRVIRSAAPLESAGPDDVSFVAAARYLTQLQSTRAGAVLIPRSLPCQLPEGATGILVDDPHAALARILPVLYPERHEPPGIHSTALIGDGVSIGEGVRIEAYVVLGRGVRLGDRARIGAHTVVGDGCSVGADTVLHPHVTLYPGVRLGERCIIHSGARLGPDGLRVVCSNGARHRIPPVGGCRIGNDVEIGSNTTVDRGAVGDTEIGDGTKLDNLVHVGHDVRLGKQVLVIAQVGIFDSAVVGDGAILGGQSGVVDHVAVGAGARVGARGMVTRDVPPRETVSGQPARPHREAMRAQASLFRLPGLMKRIQEIEKAVFGTGGPVPGKSENGAE